MRREAHSQEWLCHKEGNAGLKPGATRAVEKMNPNARREGGFLRINRGEEAVSLRKPTDSSRKTIRSAKGRE